MAAIIDGTTFNGYWKLTPNHASPLVYSVVSKHALELTSSDATSGTLSTEGGVSVSFDSTCIDENGNALNTVAKVSQYLSDNR